MPIANSSHSRSGNIGWIISGLVALFLGIDGVLRFLKVDQYVEGSLKVGFAEDQVRWIGLILIVCTVLYLLPRTAVLGGILVAAYLGGAVAIQIRAEDLGPIGFAVALGIIAWIGLALRDRRIQALVLDSNRP